MSCIQKLKNCLTSNMPDETILITATAGEGRRLLNSCIRDGGLMVGARALTPLGLAQEILADATNSGNAPRLLSRGEQLDLVYQTLTEAPTEGFSALEHVQERKTAELFLESIQEMNREEIGPVSGNERLDALQRIREAYQTKKSESMMDEADVLKAAICEAGTCDIYQNSNFVVLSSEVFPSLDRRLIETVAGERLTVIPIATPNGITTPTQCFSPPVEEDRPRTVQWFSYLRIILLLSQNRQNICMFRSLSQVESRYQAVLPTQ